MIFTRNLYLKSNVQYSIFLSLLERNDEETKFWAYELYYSGFKKEVFTILWKLYYELYATFYPNFEKFMKRKTLEWIHDMTKDWILGTIVENMVRREPCIDIYRIILSNDDMLDILENKYPFATINIQMIKETNSVSELIEKYNNIWKSLDNDIHDNDIHDKYLQICKTINIDLIETIQMLEPLTITQTHLYLSKSACISRIFTFMLFFGANENCIYDSNYNDKIKLDPKKYSILTRNDIIPYIPKPFIQCKGWKIPTRDCIYSIHNYPNSKQILISDYDCWLFYASFSPIWEKRIHKYGGIIDNENKHIYFNDEDKEETFYNLYNFDPIEQSLEIQSKWLGKCVFNNMNEIYEKYKCEIFMDWIISE